MVREILRELWSILTTDIIPKKKEWPILDKFLLLLFAGILIILSILRGGE